MDLSPHHDTLRRLTRTDPDPRVRHRADGLLLIAGGISFTKAARCVGCSRTSLRTWSQRFLAEGRAGLIDRRRTGRPRKLNAAARELLETALAVAPLDYDDPVATWTVADLTDLLARRGGRFLTVMPGRRIARDIVVTLTWTWWSAAQRWQCSARVASADRATCAFSASDCSEPIAGGRPGRGVGMTSPVVARRSRQRVMVLVPTPHRREAST